MLTSIGFTKRSRLRGRGAPREVDYDLEPFTVVTAGYKGATKSKPRDDLEEHRARERRRQQIEDIYG